MFIFQLYCIYYYSWISLSYSFNLKWNTAVSRNLFRINMIKSEEYYRNEASELFGNEINASIINKYIFNQVVKDAGTEKELALNYTATATATAAKINMNVMEAYYLKKLSSISQR